METPTPQQIATSFVNASRRELAALTLPEDLESIDFSEREIFGWYDRKIPQRAYVLVDTGDAVRGILLRSNGGAAVQAMCNWCEDLQVTSGVRMFVAKKAGSSGRNGNTLGTLIHERFDCPALVRRPPGALAGMVDPEAHRDRRVATLTEHASAFVNRILGA